MKIVAKNKIYEGNYGMKFASTRQGKDIEIKNSLNEGAARSSYHASLGVGPTWQLRICFYDQTFLSEK